MRKPKTLDFTSDWALICEAMDTLPHESKWPIRDGDGDMFTKATRAELSIVVHRGLVRGRINIPKFGPPYIRDFVPAEKVSWRTVSAMLISLRRGRIPVAEDSRTWRRSGSGYEPHHARCMAYDPMRRQVTP